MTQKILVLTIVALALAGCTQKTSRVEIEQALSPTSTPTETPSPNNAQPTEIQEKTIIPPTTHTLGDNTSIQAELDQLEKEIEEGLGTDDLTDADFAF